MKRDGLQASDEDVRFATQCIARQRLILAWLRREGWDATRAEDILAQLEELHEMYSVRCRRLRKK